MFISVSVLLNSHWC